ncbi:MAG: ammonium transporter [Bacteroidetes bacterium]|nr:ammonium transporter [Bacteroidota bacterium]
MKKNKLSLKILLSLLMVVVSGDAFAQGNINSEIASVLEVQQYERAIHIMAMLILGFGFLMVFVKKYGRSALTATFLLVSVALPFYFFSNVIFSNGVEKGEIEKLILAEFAAASLLIAAGAVLGRVKMHQYIVLGILFTVFYMFNEWVVLRNGLGLLSGAVIDTGGSITIHAFGAIFGVAAALSLTRNGQLGVTVESDATSDRFSMLGSMALWVFWPSFCAALVPVEAIPHTVINVFLALCGSTMITYVLSIWLRGKISIADIANAALAGGVAIGSTCDTAGHLPALIIGLIAGAISTNGYVLLQDRQRKFLKAVDTCGVSNLHGLPGLFGGLMAIPIVNGLNISSQLLGIVITICVALIFGWGSGKIIALTGERKHAYADLEEFMEAEIEVD